MDLGLKGKVAIVTGGARGCGFGIATELAREGVRVALTSREGVLAEESARALCEQGYDAIGLGADMKHPDQVAQVVEAVRDRYGDPLIMVVNPAAAGRPRGFENTSEADFSAGLNAWLHPLTLLARALLPAMKAAQWGRVIAIGSVAMKTPHLADPMYIGNIRVAVNAFIKTFAHEYGKLGITANTIATGPFLTELSRAYMADTGALTQEEMMAQTAMGRWGTPDEMGALVAFLCSTRAAYISGETIRIDGGYGNSLF
ncbi:MULTISPECIES: SDR family NAD(P)-dependent oxidoreductase [unclassified Sphingobium]|uniref:SDR family NAD(P)-dependent oxidoreductase n=1 Tax=unclassified Sphingobium TaxID=2611147 RepID=UPI00119B0CFC|nr:MULTISPECIES: SDR family oxidoreductase [unclassified Sphingobium]MBG6119991.1 3-oxoacyl-[acyl-carrier protein] reductase [Sphingobium sp. JAI105]TWC99570.1 3-oxoacyl-[acyl-carrier protein] reductase [Sphingobium sp. AEW010]TWD18993.1 3-oxoacyl-[acyl-carrier protein] reductase [Sphingobium sp. AEW013]TWD21864.1 3-oxoacyl-[acyl-carrier protein] reductase [Sphingobium sp. AEW001]